MKKISILIILLTFALILSSCSNVNQSEQSTNASNTNETINSTSNLSNETTIEISTNKDPENDENRTDASFSIIDELGNEIEETNNIYTITEAGKYTVKGVLEEGQIVVNASEDDKVTLSLSGVYISNSSSSPILILSSDKTDVEAKNETYNELVDKRTNASNVTDSETNYDGAIYAECDLEISGKGTLIVTSSYDNGIKTKDDLEIANVNLKVTAVGNALKGADSVTIESGSLILISQESDGIKTSNSGLSSKNKQKGIVTITGGTTDIYSYGDGINAAYDVIISGESTNVNVYTSKYSDYSSDQTLGSDFYLILSKSSYSANYDYYIYAYNNTEGSYSKFTYDTIVSGGRVQYYSLKGKLSSEYSSMIVYIVNKGVTPNDENYVAISDSVTINKNMNSFLATISSDKITGDFVNLNTNTSNSNKTTYSSKGIKAANEVNITSGNVVIYSGDDAIHANNDELENGSTGTGNIYISGGNVYITCADDGIHSDNILEISGGYINIKESHEGIEANTINIKDGTIYIYADDDGANAFKGNTTPSINISGGYLDITVSSGDTDGIDSNGNITVTGGLTIVRSGSSMGGVAGSVDLDGTLKVTGGQIVAIGGICETPSNGSICTYVSSNTSLSAGTYTLYNSSNEEILTFELTTNYSSIWLSSSSLELNGKYTLKRSGTTVLEWTQTQTILGASSSGSSWTFPGRR